MAITQLTILFFAVIAVMVVIIEAVPIDSLDDTGSNAREGRFYGYPGGVAGSSANAFAASNSMGLGGGFGLSSSNAVASASSGATGMGFRYGK